MFDSLTKLSSLSIILSIATLVVNNLTTSVSVYKPQYTKYWLEELLPAGFEAPTTTTTISQAASASIATTPTTSEASDTSTTVQEVDCRFFRALDDPNDKLEEEPKRLVNLERDDWNNTVPTPEFWITMFDKKVDNVRWDFVMLRGIYYEVGITHIFQEILEPSQPKGLVIDVGMNIGWFTILSRAMGHEVMSFDPNGIMHQRVCNSLELNGWWTNSTTTTGSSSRSSASSSGISTFLYGLGETKGELEFCQGMQPGQGSLVPERCKKHARRWKVPVTTLDTLARERGWLGSESSTSRPLIHLLKMDIEGFEAPALRGASELFRSGLIENVLHESGHGTAKNQEVALREVQQVFGTLVDSGYKIHAVTNGGGGRMHRFEVMVGPVNLMLRNGTFAGSEINEILARKNTNIWWKRIETDGDGPHTLENSVARWKELEANPPKYFKPPKTMYKNLGKPKKSKTPKRVKVTRSPSWRKRANRNNTEAEYR